MTTRAFEEALLAALPVVFERLARRYGDEQLAEEVSWDCLTRAFEVWLDDPEYFTAHDLTRWTSNRANWRALDVLRKRSRHAPLGDARGEDADHIASLADPREGEAARRLESEREAVFAGVQRLEEQDRAIVEGYYYDGHTDQEIGGLLYGDEGSEQARGLRVWRRRQKAQAQLRTILVEEGIDPSDFIPVAPQAL